MNIARSPPCVAMPSTDASALPTSQRAKPHVLDGDLRALADDMFDAQTTERGGMQKMLE